VNGAGLAMATMDMIKLSGGETRFLNSLNESHFVQFIIELNMFNSITHRNALSIRANGAGHVQKE
jgi:succinyl-CoA synthetase beta subunit